MGAIAYMPGSEPSEWETMLRGRGLSDAEAVRLIHAGDAALRGWVRENKARRFVPQLVLTVMGIGEAECIGKQ